MSANTLLGFGKYRNATYQEVKDFDLGYCRWIMDTCKSSNAPSSQMTVFAEWLRENASVRPRSFKAEPIGKPMPTPIHQPYIAEVTFSQRLHDGDVIGCLVRDPGTAVEPTGKVRVTLATGPRMWKKRLVILTNNGVFEINSQNGERAWIDIDAGLTGTRIELWKAKFLGMMTHMYNWSCGSLTQDVDLIWERD